MCALRAGALALRFTSITIATLFSSQKETLFDQNPFVMKLEEFRRFPENSGGPSTADELQDQKTYE